MSRTHNLHRLRAIAEIRSLQKSACESALGVAAKVEEQKRREQAMAQDALDLDQSLWLASLDGACFRIDASALWAGAVRTGIEAVGQAEKALGAASSRLVDARNAMKAAIADHDAAGALVSKAARAEARKRDEVTLQALEDLRLSWSLSQ